MRLLRVGEAGRERPAIVTSLGHALDLSTIVTDFDADFFAPAGSNEWQSSCAWANCNCHESTSEAHESAHRSRARARSSASA